jgi:hypothetical protein
LLVNPLRVQYFGCYSDYSTRITLSSSQVLRGSTSSPEYRIVRFRIEFVRASINQSLVLYIMNVEVKFRKPLVRVGVVQTKQRTDGQTD